jgi:predicted metalloprotease with PDZ domain
MIKSFSKNTYNVTNQEASSRVGNSIELPTLLFRAITSVNLLALALTLFISVSGVYAQDQTTTTPPWPKTLACSFGFELMTDHNGQIIVASVDSTSGAYRMGVRPGMDVIGWNTLPIQRKLQSMRVRKYRKTFPMMSDDQIKLLILTRARPGDSAEVFFMTPTGNNRGIRVEACSK